MDKVFLVLVLLKGLYEYRKESEKNYERGTLGRVSNAVAALMFMHSKTEDGAASTLKREIRKLEDAVLHEYHTWQLSTAPKSDDDSNLSIIVTT